MGLQQRQVGCQSPNGESLPDDKCHDSKRPETVKLCWKSPCVNNSADQKNRPETNILRKWTVSNWTAVSMILLYMYIHFLSVSLIRQT